MFNNQCRRRNRHTWIVAPTGVCINRVEAGDNSSSDNTATARALYRPDYDKARVIFTTQLLDINSISIEIIYKNLES